MRKTLIVLAAIVMVASVVGFVPAAGAMTALQRAEIPAAQPAKLPATTGDVTVAYYAAGGEAKALATARGKGAKLERRSSKLGIIVVDPPAGVSAEKFAAQMAATPGIRYAEPVRPMRALFTPNDTYFSDQWGLMRIHMPTAWEATLGDSSVTVAVIDTGFDFGTLDKPVNLDTTNDHDFSGATEDSVAEDLNGHGTHTTGIVAAQTNNALGIASVAPGVTILPIRVLDANGNGDDVKVALGIDWAVSHGADVINLSLGGPGGTATLEEAVDNALANDCVVVAAAGNSATDPGYTPGEIYYPAAYPDVIAVGATDSSDARADFSQYGPALDLVAPGVEIWSLWLRHPLTGQSRIAPLQGTSEAAPHVAGVAGLLRSLNTTWTATQVEQALKDTAQDLGAAGFDQFYGHGLVMADAALNVVGTNLTINVTPTTPAWGASAVAMGSLQSDAGPLATREITIESKPYGSSVWSAVATASTDGAGSYQATVRPTRQTAYRAHFAREGELVQATSAVKTVTPKAYLTSPTVPQKVLVNNYFTSYGYLRPKHTKGAKSVKIKCYLWNSAAGEYRYHHYVWAVNQDYASWTPTTKYVARYKLPHRGKWKLYAGISGDYLHATTYSLPRYVTVR